jgi:hypothetical protein
MSTQTQTKFTPGPWQAYNSEQQRIFKTWRVQSATGRTICSMANLNEQDQHNALLCSLAPEAIKALAACLEWMEFTIPRLKGKCPHCAGTVDRGGLNWGGPISKARAILARLEGGK